MPPLLPDMNNHNTGETTSVAGEQGLKELPNLTETPFAYPGCCLALSKPLVAHIASILPPSPSTVLSIGCGFGLLEAYLVCHLHHMNLIGVEVEPSPNVYLPAADHRVVRSTRFLEPLAAEAKGWLFVYPRRVGLVREYLTEYGHGSLERVVWIGPKNDWDDYKSSFAGWHVQLLSADEVGGRAWELIVIVHKSMP